MYEYGRVAGFYIVGVEAGDGEVVYGWVSYLAAGLGDAECLASGGAESGAGGESVGGCPGVVGLVEEQVVLGCDDRAGSVAALAVCVERDLYEVVVAGSAEGCDDRFCSGFSGRWVGGEDFVAWFNFFDGFSCAVGEAYLGSGDETVTCASEQFECFTGFDEVFDAGE